MRTAALAVVSALPVLAQERAAAPAAPAETAVAMVVGGTGYVWSRSWGRPLDGAALGTSELGNTHGCLVATRDGRILANTDTEHAVVAFAPDGRITGSWGKEFHGGLHGMCLRVEDGSEVLYLAHTRRHEIVKTTIDGAVQWTLGWPQASGVYENEDQYKPTAVAVAPDGRIFAADGYGKSWVHIYDKDRSYLKSFGGRGTEPGKMQTPHGLWLDTRGERPLLLVCDRENHRLQWFDMDGTFVRLMDQDLRRPCNVWPLGDGGLVVADLAGRITFLNAQDQLVGHLGDNPDPQLRAQNGVPRDRWRDGEFLSPHSVCVDGGGNVYVMDWNSLGRITKLERLPFAFVGSR